jgi:hypothetical protein
MHIRVILYFRPEYVLQMQCMPTTVFYLAIETELPLLFGLFREGRFLAGVLF